MAGLEIDVLGIVTEVIPSISAAKSSINAAANSIDGLSIPGDFSYASLIKQYASDIRGLTANVDGVIGDVEGYVSRYKRAERKSEEITNLLSLDRKLALNPTKKDSKNKVNVNKTSNLNGALDYLAGKFKTGVIEVSDKVKSVILNNPSTISKGMRTIGNTKISIGKFRNSLVRDKLFSINNGISEIKNNAYIENFMETLANIQKEYANKSYTYDTSSLISFDIEATINDPRNITCCATLASTAIYLSGYVTEEEINSCKYNSSTALCKFLVGEMEWKYTKKYDEMKPGDIVFMKDEDGINGHFNSVEDCNLEHTQIYAGGNLWYNAGKTEDIQAPGPVKKDESESRERFIIAVSPQMKEDEKEEKK